MEKEIIVVKGKEIEQKGEYTSNSGKEISYERGAKMVKRHFDENPDDAIAHFFGKDAILKLINQPGCIGIRALHAINDLGIRDTVMVGVDVKGNNIIQITDVNKQIRPGIVMHGEKACPPYCGSSGTSTDSGSWF